MNEEWQIRYDDLWERSKERLVHDVMELEDIIDANEHYMSEEAEKMQIMDQVIELQDKMLDDFARDLDDCRSGKLPKLIPKPVWTNEEKVKVLKSKLKR